MSEKRNVPSLRFQEFQENWVERKLDEAFKNSRKKGKKGFPIYSVSQAKGLVPRDSLDRVIQNDAKPEQNLLVEPGELTYNMMRMWQGAYGVSSTTCMVSPAYVVLTPKKQHLSQFYSFLFERARSRYLFTTYSHGLTLDRLRLYPGDFLSIPILFTSLPEQQRIAEFLTSVDQRIELLQAKKEKLEAYKKGVMKQIFSQKLRFKADDGSDFPDWGEKKLGEILDYKQPTKYLVSSTEYNDSYPTPVLTAGKTFLLGYTDETTGIFEKNLPTIIFDDFTTSFQYVDFPFKAKSSAMKMLVPRDSSVNLKYVFESMLQIKFVPGDHKRHWISEFQEFEIPYPSEVEQKKIVQFLTGLDSTIETLEKQINHTQTWKKGLLQKMFV